MADLRTDFPQVSSRLVNPDGTITDAWYMLLVQLFNRTGGPGGGGSAITPEGIIETAFAQIPQNANPQNALVIEQLISAQIPQNANSQNAFVIEQPISAQITASGSPVSADVVAPAFCAQRQDTQEMVLPPPPVENPCAVVSLNLTTSPLVYTASRRMALSIDGTVTGITLARGSWSRTLSTSTQMIELNTGDRVTVNFSTAPAVAVLSR